MNVGGYILLICINEILNAADVFIRVKKKY